MLEQPLQEALVLRRLGDDELTGEFLDGPDGSAGVTTQSTFGAKVTFLAEVGLALLVGGLVLLVASVLFVYFALRGRGTAATGGAAAVPATA